MAKKSAKVQDQVTEEIQANEIPEVTENFEEVTEEVTAEVQVTENPAMMEEAIQKVIVIDTISHGAMKKGAFAFVRNGVPTPVPGFPVIAPNEFYNYTHSCDNGCWEERLGKFGIVSYENAKNAEGVQATYNSWKANTLHALYQLLTSGELDITKVHEGKTYDIRVQSTVDPTKYPATELEFTTKTAKTKASKLDLALLFD